jgi:hypothetical protein
MTRQGQARPGHDKTTRRGQDRPGQGSHLGFGGGGGGKGRSWSGTVLAGSARLYIKHPQPERREREMKVEERSRKEGKKDGRRTEGQTEEGILRKKGR